jgi:hypothetical protein
MQYQFEEPFIVDSNKIANKLGISATPLDAAIAGTLQAFRPEQSPGRPMTRSKPQPIPASPDWHCGENRNGLNATTCQWEHSGV